MSSLVADDLGSRLPEAKKARLDTSEGLSSDAKTSDEKTPFHDDSSLLPFQNFSVDEVFYADPRTKLISVLGRFASSENQGIIVAEKQPLTESSLAHLFSPSNHCERKFQNNVYSQYVMDCETGGLGQVRLTTVYPAAEEHKKKYAAQKLRMMVETPKRYEEVTKPIIEKQALSLDVSEQQLTCYEQCSRH